MSAQWRRRGVPMFGDPWLVAALLRRENGRERQGRAFCAFCAGGPLSGKPGQRYCSDACRAAAWKARKARARREQYRPLRPTAARILDRLEREPATGTDLARIAKRYGARIHELRQRGHRIHCYVDRGPRQIEGLSVYWSGSWMEGA